MFISSVEIQVISIVAAVAQFATKVIMVAVFGLSNYNIYLKLSSQRKWNIGLRFPRWNVTSNPAAHLIVAGLDLCCEPLLKIRWFAVLNALSLHVGEVDVVDNNKIRW